MYVQAEGLTAVVIGDHEYPQRVAHSFINKVNLTKYLLQYVAFGHGSSNQYHKLDNLSSMFFFKTVVINHQPSESCID